MFRFLSLMLAVLMLAPAIHAANPGADTLTVARNVTTDQGIALRIVYIGSTAAGAAGPTVEVNAGGDILFTTDGTVADATVSTDGTVDLSTPAAGEDTFGEVADVINASTNWKCILVDVLPSWTTDNILSTTAETNGTTGVSATYNLDGKNIRSQAGLAITYNTADLDKHAVCLGPQATTDEISIPKLLNRVALPNPTTDPTAALWYSTLTYISSVSTFTTGGGPVEIYDVYGNGAAAVEKKVWSQVSGATTVAVTWPPLAGLNLKSAPGHYYLVVMNDTVTPDTTAATIQVFGTITPSH